jgi:hypothetical protein
MLTKWRSAPLLAATAIACAAVAVQAWSVPADPGVITVQVPEGRAMDLSARLITIGSPSGCAMDPTPVAVSEKDYALGRALQQVDKVAGSFASGVRAGLEVCMDPQVTGGAHGSAEVTSGSKEGRTLDLKVALDVAVDTEQLRAAIEAAIRNSAPGAAATPPGVTVSAGPMGGTANALLAAIMSDVPELSLQSGIAYDFGAGAWEGTSGLHYKVSKAVYTWAGATGASTRQTFGRCTTPAPAGISVSTPADSSVEWRVWLYRDAGKRVVAAQVDLAVTYTKWAGRVHVASGPLGFMATYGLTSGRVTLAPTATAKPTGSWHLFAGVSLNPRRAKKGYDACVGVTTTLSEGLFE